MIGQHQQFNSTHIIQETAKKARRKRLEKTNLPTGTMNTAYDNKSVASGSSTMIILYLGLPSQAHNTMLYSRVSFLKWENNSKISTFETTAKCYRTSCYCANQTCLFAYCYEKCDAEILLQNIQTVIRRKLTLAFIRLPVVTCHKKYAAGPTQLA